MATDLSYIYSVNPLRKDVTAKCVRLPFSLCVRMKWCVCVCEGEWVVCESVCIDVAIFQSQYYYSVSIVRR